MINEAEVKRRFKNLISTTQLLKRISQYGYEGDYTEQALYILLDKYGIKAKTKRGSKSYFNKKNACDCIGRHIFELRELAEELRHENEQSAYDDEYYQDSVGYGRDDMSVASREALANDGVFGADENDLYTNESIFSFKNIVNEVLSYLDEGYQRPSDKFDVLYKLPTPSDLSDVETTAHWAERDGRRKEFAKLYPTAGKPVYSFVVDTGHPNGLEIHTITENGFIFVQNKRTKRVVTFILPSVNRFCRYWDSLGIPYPDRNDRTFNKIIGRVGRNNKDIKNIRK